MGMTSYHYFMLVVLTALMILTRGSHFAGMAALPEASWMIFMIAGAMYSFTVFCWFVGLAIGIDAYAFTYGDVPGTCLSVAYGMLIPAHLSMWLAGKVAGAYLDGGILGYLAFFALALGGTAVCELISSASFYFWSGNFETSFSEFIDREKKYAPAMFASSAFWAIAFVCFSVLSGVFKQMKLTGILSR